MIVAFYKPYGVVSQFTPNNPGEKTLADFNLPANIYAAGRLDKDSEGLLVLSDQGDFIQRLTNPKFDKKKYYWSQVERIPSEQSLVDLRSGVTIKGGYKTLPCEARLLEMELPERDPPIRFRKNVPTCWLELIITEGKNRQVRSMTAAIGHPTLRLIRFQVGKLRLTNMQPGQWQEVKVSDIL